MKVMSTVFLPLDPKHMNDIAPDHPARHNARNGQSYSRVFAPLPDEQPPRPIRARQDAWTPASPRHSANQHGAAITNSLHCKGEWRSYCRSIDTPCFFIWPEITFFPQSVDVNFLINTGNKKDSRSCLEAVCRISAPPEFLDAIPVGGCGRPRGLDAITRTRYAAAEITKNRHPRVQIRRWVSYSDGVWDELHLQGLGRDVEALFRRPFGSI